MGGPKAGERALRQAVLKYKRVARVSGGDQVVIGVNPNLRENTRSSWPGAYVLVQHGPDGADRALLEYAKAHDTLARQFDRIVVGFGDHIFVDVVTTFRDHGLPVEVVSLERCLSAALVASASHVRNLPDVVHPV